MSVFSEIKLGDAVTFQRGFDITKAEQTLGSVPIVSSSGISSFHNKIKVKQPGVVIGRKGTLGTVHFLTQDFWPHDTTLWVKDFKGNIPQFVAYFLSTLKLENFDTGSSNPTLNRNHLHKIKVLFPKDPKVQRKIAGILTAYDELIETNKRRIALLEKVAEELYREWFVRMRFPGHENTKFVKGVPEGWEVTSIEQVCERVTDGAHLSPESVEDGMPMASSKDMHSFGLDLQTARRISRKDFEQLVKNGCQPRANDILITKDGANYLKHIFVVENNLEVVLLSSIAILTPSDRINPHLFAAILSSSGNRERLKNYVTGAAIPRIILKDFKKFQFLLPPEAIQIEWAKVGASTVKLCCDFITQNQILTQTRDLLLPRLISGKLSVENRDIQFPPSMAE